MVIVQFVGEIIFVIFLYIWQLVKDCLYFVMHVLINIVVTVQHFYHRVWVKKACSPNGVASDIRVLMEHISRLRKPLNHLVLLADTERHSLSDLARVVIWSLMAKVAYISFHDVTGHLKQDEEKLLKEVERHKKEASDCNKLNSNEFTDLLSRAVVINIFSSNDGRPKITQIIRRIAAERVQNPQNYREITVQKLNSMLSLVYSFPDPDVILYTGPSCRIHGLLPWQIRLTEFVRLSPDHSFNVHSFVDAMYKYNKSDQRFGK